MELSDDGYEYSDLDDDDDDDDDDAGQEQPRGKAAVVHWTSPSGVVDAAFGCAFALDNRGSDHFTALERLDSDSFALVCQLAGSQAMLACEVASRQLILTARNVGIDLSGANDRAFTLSELGTLRAMRSLSGIKLREMPTKGGCMHPINAGNTAMDTIELRRALSRRSKIDPLGLRSVDISGCLLGAETVGFIIADGISGGGIEVLRLVNCHLGETSIRALAAAVARPTRLVELDVRGNDFWSRTAEGEETPDKKLAMAVLQCTSMRLFNGMSMRELREQENRRDEEQEMAADLDVA